MKIGLSYVADGKALTKLDYSIDRTDAGIIEEVKKLLPNKVVKDDGDIKTSLTLTVDGTATVLFKANLKTKTLGKVNKVLITAFMKLNTKHSG
jgi:hypothetical protein